MRCGRGQRRVWWGMRRLRGASDGRKGRVADGGRRPQPTASAEHTVKGHRLAGGGRSVRPQRLHRVSRASAGARGACAAPAPPGSLQRPDWAAMQAQVLGQEMWGGSVGTNDIQHSAPAGSLWLPKFAREPFSVGVSDLAASASATRLTHETVWEKTSKYPFVHHRLIALEKRQQPAR